MQQQPPKMLSPVGYQVSPKLPYNRQQSTLLVITLHDRIWNTVYPRTPSIPSHRRGRSDLIGFLRMQAPSLTSKPISWIRRP